MFSLFVSFPVEDPSEDFVRLRDFVDVGNALQLLKAFSDPAIVKAGFSEDMVKVSVKYESAIGRLLSSL